MNLEIRSADSSWKLSPATATASLGRLPSCAVRVCHPLVSRRHGRFLWRGDGWWFEDTSRHGTLVTGADGAQRPLHNDTVALDGGAVLHLSGSEGPALRCSLLEDQDAPTVHEQFAAGVALQQAQQWRQAAHRFLALARRSPPVVEALRRAAACLERDGRVPEAILWLTRYTFHRAEDSEAWKDLARLHTMRGEVADAVDCLARATRLDDGDPQLAGLRRRLDAAREAAAVRDLSTREVLASDVQQQAQTAHFTIRYDLAAHGRLLPDLAKALEAAASTAENLLPPLPGRTTVTLLGHNATPGEAPALGDRTAAAVCDTTGIRVFLPPGRTRACSDAAFLMTLAAHEVVHAHLLAAAGPVPWWLHEGLAQFISTGGHLEGPLAAPPQPRSAADFETAPPPGDVDLAYTLAFFSVAALVDLLGRDGLAVLVASVVAGTPVGAALARYDLSYPAVAERAHTLWSRQEPDHPVHLRTLDRVPEGCP